MNILWFKMLSFLILKSIISENFCFIADFDAETRLPEFLRVGASKQSSKIYCKLERLGFSTDSCDRSSLDDYC